MQHDESRPDSGITLGAQERPHAARMYDYFLGGKDHYAADRNAADKAREVWPHVAQAARANRHFMHRAVHTLARQGFRQFLDIGTGIPTSPNLHEIAQAVTPEARVVYTDHDPIVLSHARALLTGTDEGHTDFVQADITQPEHILDAPELQSTLDLAEPVALSANAVLHFVTDDHDPYGIIAQLLNALPSGSALCLTHVTADLDQTYIPRVVEVYNAQGVSAQARSRDEVERFFTGLEFLDPGIVPAHKWRPETRPQHEAFTGTGTDVPDEEVSIWAGIGIKQ
ncbi:SAM-dependent methyltransferase [Streptomyces sp. TR02-1]|uniref:SAM-dependent methyltransferase n=1 Tax=Streptomyces sp. TR02-1 TaxID=3385977 RepID=UPI0039A2FB21